MESLKVLTEAIKTILEGKIIYIKDAIVMKGRCSGSIYVPKEFIGKKVRIFITNENEITNISRGRPADIPDEVLPKQENMV